MIMTNTLHKYINLKQGYICYGGLKYRLFNDRYYKDHRFCLLNDKRFTENLCQWYDVDITYLPNGGDLTFKD